MIISQLKPNDIVSIHFPETKQNKELSQFAIVTEVDDEKQETKIRPFGQTDAIIVPWDMADIADQIKDVPLSKSLVERFGFSAAEGNLFMLPQHEYWYELTLMPNGYVTVIQIKIENGEWVAIIPKFEAYFGCRFEYIPSVRALQNFIRSACGLDSLADSFSKIFNK